MRNMVVAISHGPGVFRELGRLAVIIESILISLRLRGDGLCSQTAGEYMFGPSRKL